MPPVRKFQMLLCACFGLLLLVSAAQAQSPAPSATQSDSGRIYGTVTDPADNVIVDAVVTLSSAAPLTPITHHTDASGFFSFTGLPAGEYQIRVEANGFGEWSSASVHLAAGEFRTLSGIILHVATNNTSVRVSYTAQEIAEQQVHVQEKQRVLGAIPNFFTSYVWDAEPLTPRQKFSLAWKSSIDPVNFILAGASAGIQQAQNDFSGYGQGAQGYGKRFGASYANGFSGMMIGGAILPSLLHQDPRYFYKGTGTIRFRILYSLSTAFICKGDNGRWQPNYSNMLGSFAAAGISNAYYPAANRGATLTVENGLLGIAASAAAGLIQEFVLKKISTGVPADSPRHP